MPTYEYNCPNCGVFEEFHSIKEQLTHCPKCGREISRLISRNQNIIFKGTGFHTTDYRSGDYQKKVAGENPGSSATPSEKKENKPTVNETKSENKSESKAKSKTESNAKSKAS